jgi:hypothetical protein
MKTPCNSQDPSPRNIAELIAHLWKLYYAMTLDPMLAVSAEPIREAVLELEEMRRVALQVAHQEQEARSTPRARKPRKRRKTETESPAEWLRNLPAASPLKQ